MQSYLSFSNGDIATRYFPTLFLAKTIVKNTIFQHKCPISFHFFKYLHKVN